MKDYKEELDELYKVVVALDSVDACKAFFDDLCTKKELESMAQRLKAAEMLIEGKTYNEITEQTEISSATLSRVSRCVHYGDGGYKNAIGKIKN